MELATLYAKNNYNLYLAGRSINDIESESNELKSKYNVSVKLCEFDITKYSKHKSFYDSLDKNLIGVIIISGYYPLQSDADWSAENSFSFPFMPHAPSPITFISESHASSA